MLLEVTKCLEDVRQACQLLQSFTHGKSLQDYLAEALLRAGVEREFITIGEALIKAEKLDSALTGSITNLRRIIGFRNVLVHGYAQVNHQTVWGVLQKDLPILFGEVNTLLATSPP